MLTLAAHRIARVLNTRGPLSVQGVYFNRRHGPGGLKSGPLEEESGRTVVPVNPGDRNHASGEREFPVPVEEGRDDLLVLDALDAAGRVHEAPAGCDEPRRGRQHLSLLERMLAKVGLLEPPL